MRTKQIAPVSTTLLIARKELLENLLSFRFHACLIIMVGLFALSILVMYSDFALRKENYAVLHERAQYRQGESGIMAIVPPRPLSILGKGLDETIGRGYSVSAFLGIEAHTRQKRADSLFALLPPPDLLYIVKVVLSLLAILLAYDAVTGERERNTLVMILSSPVARSHVIFGKMLGGLLSITIPFALCLTGAVAFLLARPTVGLNGDDVARIALIAFASLVYVSFFHAMGVLVSSAMRTSASALVTLLTLWAVLVFAVPHASALAAETIAPIPSAETSESMRTLEFLKNRFLAIQSDGRNPQGSFAAFNRAYDLLVESSRIKLERLARAAHALGRLSPASTFDFLFTELAGTGLSEYERLTRALVSYKNASMPALVEMLEDEPPPGFQPPPELTLRRLPLATTLTQGPLQDLAALIMASVAAVVAAVAVFCRKDAR